MASILHAMQKSDVFARKLHVADAAATKLPPKLNEGQERPRDKNLTLHEGNIKNYLEFLRFSTFSRTEVWNMNNERKLNAGFCDWKVVCKEWSNELATLNSVTLTDYVENLKLLLL